MVAAKRARVLSLIDQPHGRPVIGQYHRQPAVLNQGKSVSLNGRKVLTQQRPGAGLFRHRIVSRRRGQAPVAAKLTPNKRKERPETLFFYIGSPLDYFKGSSGELK